MKWVKDHIIELITLIMTCSAGIASFASGIADAFRAEPLALIIWSVFMVAIGLCIGWGIRGAVIFVRSANLGVLRGKRAVRYVENQPEAYKDILREALDRGGVLYADPMDGDMRILASRGFFDAPTMFVSGCACPWALKPSVIELLKAHPECLEGDEGNE